MANAKGKSPMETPAHRVFPPPPSVNEFVLEDDYWHPSIRQVDLLPADDEFSPRKVQLTLIGPGTLQSIKKEVRIPYVFGIELGDNEEPELTPFTALWLALEIIEPKDLEEDCLAETQASIDLTAAIGLAVRCRTYKGQMEKQVGNVTLRNKFTSVIPATISLDR